VFSQYLDTEWNSKTYKNHYRIGGMKLTLDGSPQGRTAGEPYHIYFHLMVQEKIIWAIQQP
jgi:hypothetical protein